MKVLEKRWERQLEEVLQAKTNTQKELAHAMKDVREAQQDAERALTLLNQVQTDLASAKESETGALARLEVDIFRILRIGFFTKCSKLSFLSNCCQK